MSDAPLPLVGIPCDVNQLGLHAFQGVGEKYIHAVTNGANVCPVLIPALLPTQRPGQDLRKMNQQIIIPSLLENLKGLFLSGSPSNIHPNRYSDEKSLTPGQHDTQRDDITLELIKAAISKGIPILAVCRGMQEVNVALGGTLHQQLHALENMQNHRENKQADRTEQYQPSHLINLVHDGLLQRLNKSTSVKVNSLHNQGIKKLASSLRPEAIAEDGLIEAFSYSGKSQFLIGVQWHPEWQFEQNAFSVSLLNAFGQAVRKYAQSH